MRARGGRGREASEAASQRKIFFGSPPPTPLLLPFSSIEKTRKNRGLWTVYIELHTSLLLAYLAPMSANDLKNFQGAHCYNKKSQSKCHHWKDNPLVHSKLRLSVRCALCKFLHCLPQNNNEHMHTVFTGGILEGKQDLWFKTNIAVCSRKRLTEIKTPDALLLTLSFVNCKNIFVTFVASINTSSVDTVLEIIQLSRVTSVLGNLLPLRPGSMRNKNRKTKVLPEIDLKLIWSIPVYQSPSRTADRHRRTLGSRLGSRLKHTSQFRSADSCFLGSSLPRHCNAWQYNSPPVFVVSVDVW